MNCKVEEYFEIILYSQELSSGKIPSGISLFLDVWQIFFINIMKNLTWAPRPDTDDIHFPRTRANSLAIIITYIGTLGPGYHNIISRVRRLRIIDSAVNSVQAVSPVPQVGGTC